MNFFRNPNLGLSGDPHPAHRPLPFMLQYNGHGRLDGHEGEEGQAAGTGTGTGMGMGREGRGGPISATAIAANNRAEERFCNDQPAITTGWIRMVGKQQMIEMAE